MKLMLLLFMILFKSSLERNVAIDSPLENYENKKYPTYKNSLFKSQFKLDGFLGNGDSKSYTTNGYCVYLDKLEFDKNLNEIEVKVTVYGGIFNETEMFYLGSDEEKEHDEMIEFDQSIGYDREEVGSYSHETLYKKYTYYFMIPISEKQYIYISIPQAKLTDEGYIEISIQKAFPGWAIALIVIGSIAIIAFIIILIITKCFKECDNLKYCCSNCC